MRIVALEEHFVVPSLARANFDVSVNPAYLKNEKMLGDLGPARLADMDEGGITHQVISATMPGADLLDGKEGVDFATATNDRLALAVREYPDRFGGFAHLPMRTPEAAADELERAVRDLGFRGAMVNGLTENQFLDHPRFAPVLERAVALDVPIYIHPNVPPKPVADIYYSDLPGVTGQLLGTGGFGWHSETAIHVLRLVFSGTFEKYPTLKVIVGHMGEMLPFMLGRNDWLMAELNPVQMRPVSEIVTEHVYITISGFWDMAPFACALATFGADRIMYSVDYPFISNVAGKRFLDLLPVSPADRIKIAHGNADKLLKLSA
jgi:predicted TIM-barrel fold metal-dependent hydrolase